MTKPDAAPAGPAAGILGRVRSFVDPRAMVDTVRKHFDETGKDLDDSIERLLRTGLEPGEEVRRAVFERRRVPRGHDLLEIAMLGGVVAAAVAFAPDASDIDIDGPGVGSMHCGLWLTDRRLIALGYTLSVSPIPGGSGWSARYGWVGQLRAARVYPLSALPDVKIHTSLATAALNLGDPVVPKFEVLFFRYQREMSASADAFASEVQRLRGDRRAGAYR